MPSAKERKAEQDRARRTSKAQAAKAAGGPLRRAPELWKLRMAWWRFSPCVEPVIS